MQGTGAPQGSLMDPNSQGMTAIPVNLRHQFMIEHTLPDGTKLEDQFTCKKLAIKEIAAVSVRKTHLNGGFHHNPENPGQGIDADTDWTNQMIAHLEVCLIQKPMWFNLDNIYDADLLIKIYSEVAKFENTFISPQLGAAVDSRSSQVDSGAKSEGTGAAGRVEAVGGGEVEAALEP